MAAGARRWQKGAMPSDRDFVEAARLAAELRAADGGDPFAVYLERRGAGLKSEALQALDGFLAAATATAWPEARRRAFVLWLGGARDRFDDPGLVAPHPLVVGLVLPVLAAWAEAAPGDPEPHLLRGLFHDYRTGEADPETHFRRALERDPAHPRARSELARVLIDRAAGCAACGPTDAELVQTRGVWLDEAAALARGLPDEAGLLETVARLRREAGEPGRQYFFPA